MIIFRFGYSGRGERGAETRVGRHARELTKIWPARAAAYYLRGGLGEGEGGAANLLGGAVAEFNVFFTLFELRLRDAR